MLTGSSIQAVAPTPILTTRDASEGVLLECYRQGSKLRIRAISPGYNSSWSVQFPSNIRETGARYVASEVRESSSGGFYRASGEIKKLI